MAEDHTTIWDKCHNSYEEITHMSERGGRREKGREKEKEKEKVKMKENVNKKGLTGS